MTTDNILLSETVVTAKAPEIVVRGDTLEYNADSYKVTESAVVEDLLKKMPEWKSIVKEILLSMANQSLKF